MLRRVNERWLRMCMPGGRMPVRLTSSASRCRSRRRDISPSMNSTRAGRMPRQCRKPRAPAIAVARAMANMVLPMPVGGDDKEIKAIVAVTDHGSYDPVDTDSTKGLYSSC
jgi:hypothetical protein